ncbi:MAG: hypothetical protein H6686_10200 [Fibrobacteria bacterium]|nr:hypothetical protein [Fibrobacteria bacterium]
MSEAFPAPSRSPLIRPTSPLPSILSVVSYRRRWRFDLLRIFALSFLASCVTDQARPVLALCGDSTMAEYLVQGDIRGWGQELPSHLDPKILVANRAVPGATAASFFEESWDAVKRMAPAWIVFQFGHNPGDPRQEEFSLRSMIHEARAIGSVPLLIAPMAGRNRTILLPHLDSVMRSVAKSESVPIIPLDSLSLLRWKAMDNDSLDRIFIDFIHPTPLGASVIASMVAPLLDELLNLGNGPRR